MIIKFFVHGLPKSQPRPRACVRGNHASVYDAGTANDWKYSVARTARENSPEKPFSGPVALYITIYLPRPKSHFYTSKKRGGELREDAPIYCAKKPDVDNYAKAIMDALTDSGVIWMDDAQVVDINCRKLFADDAAAGAKITIKELAYSILEINR